LIQLYPVPEFSAPTVEDPGVPNRERITLNILEPVNLGRYWLLIGRRGPEGGVAPLVDSFFWFGEKFVVPPALIHVFTGPGSFKETSGLLAGTSYHFYWGRKVTVFGAQESTPLVPILVRIGSAVVGTVETASTLASKSAGSYPTLSSILKEKKG
jgi:hypothetical protein